MDIVELSLKMEADLLESRSNESSYLKPVSEIKFSPRITRSQTSKGVRHLMEESAVAMQQRKNYKKVDEVEKIYLNKKAKIVHKNLETIYEDPIWKKGNTMLLGTNKIKRFIYLDREFRITSKQKSKLRKLKIKRLGKKIKPSKLPDEEFRNRMLRIENYLNENDVEIECKSENGNDELINCDNYGDHRDLESGSVELIKSNENIDGENKDLELGNELLFE